MEQVSRSVTPRALSETRISINNTDSLKSMLEGTEKMKVCFNIALNVGLNIRQ